MDIHPLFTFPPPQLATLPLRLVSSTRPTLPPSYLRYEPPPCGGSMGHWTKGVGAENKGPRFPYHPGGFASGGTVFDTSQNPRRLLFLRPMLPVKNPFVPSCFFVSCSCLKTRGNNGINMLHAPPAGPMLERSEKGGGSYRSFSFSPLEKS